MRNTSNAEQAMLTIAIIITIVDAFWLSVLVFDALPRQRERAAEKERVSGYTRETTRPSG